jgi:hypothetical protein
VLQAHVRQIATIVAIRHPSQPEGRHLGGAGGGLADALLAWMSLPVMLPKMPHATSIWAGTAPAQASVIPASACSTSTPCSPVACAACRASATLRSSSSTSRAHVVSAWMSGQHADHFPALPGAQPDQADVPSGRTFEWRTL